METLIIQTGVRHGRIAEIVRSHDDSFTIGRGFDNDLVLTDLHIAPQQLKFSRDSSGWKLIVLDDTNPVMLNGVKVEDCPVDVKSGDRVSVGRTKLSLFAEDHPVGETKKLLLQNWLSGQPSPAFIPIAVLLLAGLIDFCIAFFEVSTDLKWQEPVMTVVASTLIVLIWSGIWAVTGRISRHQHQFGTQVIGTSVIGVFSTLLMTVAAYLVYPFHSESIQQVVGWLVAFITIALLLRFNLMMATNVQRPAVVGCMVAGLMMASFFSLTYLGKTKTLKYEPVYSSSLKPPVLRVLDGMSSDAYFLGVAATVHNLEAGLLESLDQKNKEDSE